jgi:hypothetical protein
MDGGLMLVSWVPPFAVHGTVPEAVPQEKYCLLIRGHQRN